VDCFAGVDIGSVAAKAAILADDGIVATAEIPAKISSEKSGVDVFETVMEKAKLSREDVKYTIATGYGRISAPFANATVTEISCHGQGAYFMNPDVGTVIDMGGQDCKVIKLGHKGQAADFAMNEKCAAGTGRFLEVMARVFEISLDELGPISIIADNRVPISSTCVVFAETEVVSLMARGEKTENIIDGIHYSLARRVSGLLARIGIQEEVALTGGVGKNIGMRKNLEEVLGIKLTELNSDPIMTGAVGAAVIARMRTGKT
jgi:predicted CoA-substrate-specific enzyme activase